MDVNKWMSYECSDESTYTQNSHNLSPRSHGLEEEIALAIVAKIASVNGP
jgi:hypothetical protein